MPSPIVPQRRHLGRRTGRRRAGSGCGTGSRTAGRARTAGRRRAAPACRCALPRRVGDRRRGQQRLRVGVRRAREDPLAGALLDELAEVHHRDVVGEVLHRGQVVGDEQAGEAHVALQVGEQVEHRGLHRHVERAGRLVGDEQRRLGDQRPGDADPLALAAGQLVRVAAGDLGAQPDPAELLGHPGLQVAPGEPLAGCSRSGSATTSPTSIRGSSEPAGSWKTMDTSRRCGRSWRRDRWVTSAPCEPDRARRSARAGARCTGPTVDLPEPLSPTRAMTWPRRDAAATPRRRRGPAPKCMTRSSSSRTTSSGRRLLGRFIGCSPARRRRWRPVRAVPAPTGCQQAARWSVAACAPTAGMPTAARGQRRRRRQALRVGGRAAVGERAGVGLWLQDRHQAGDLAAAGPCRRAGPAPASADSSPAV